jgi:APA family basic amino acid/polyamine antiporter
MTGNNMERNFVRGLGLFDSTLLVAGTIIGSGIFIVPADIARQVGSPGWLLTTWIIGGVMTMMAALSYGELAAMMPRAGGQYVYLREAHGPLMGFLYGWTLFLVIQTGSIAAVAVAFAKFLAVLAPAFSGFGERLVAVGVILVLTVINIRGIRAGKTVQNVFTVAKLAALAALIIPAFLRASPASAIYSSEFWTPVRNGQTLDWSVFVPIFGVAMVGVFFSYDAWNNITFTAAEVKNPRRTLPITVPLGVAIVMTVYVLTNAAYLCALSMQEIQNASEDRVGTAAAQTILGSGAEAFLAVAVLISTFGSDNGMILAGSRAYYAMACDGLFFSRAGKLNRHGVPAASLLMQAAWASLLTVSGTYSDLVDYVVFAVLLFYVLTIAAVFRLRVRRPDLERPYKAFGYPWIPALYVTLAAMIMIALLVYKPAYTWPGLLIVLAGVPVYHFSRRRSLATQSS